MILVIQNGWSAQSKLTTFTGHTVCAWNLESQDILHRLKENGNLLWWEAHRLEFFPGQHCTDAIEEGKKGDRDMFLQLAANLFDGLRTCCA
jgi:hypothetical protein